MKGQKKKATIKDVALLAGVSPATVSMVLNEKPVSLPDSTKEKVKQAARELNYNSHFIARAMVTGKTHTVGVIIPDISNAFFAEAVRAMQIAFSKCGYDIILCDSEERWENDLKYIELLAGRCVDGIIFTPSAESLIVKNKKAIQELLSSLDIPYLFLDRYFSGNAPSVAVDNLKSSYEAATHLLENGHTKIGVICGSLRLNSSKNRLRGVKKALADFGLTLDDNLIYEGKYDFETGVLGSKMLIQRGITAIFAFSDMQAYGVYESVKSERMSVPKDISVIGFDDTFYSAILDVPLTTMRQPIKEIGQEACSMMLRLIGGDQSKIKARLKARIVVRSSVKKIKE